MADESASASVAQPFRAFVDEDPEHNDLIGYVAYALYKKDELDFVVDRESVTDSGQRAVELGAFRVASLLPSRVQSYRDQAAVLLQEFADRALDGAEGEVEARYRQKYVDDLAKARPFIKTLGDNILANLATLGIVALLVLLIYGSRIGLIPLLGEVFNYEVREKALPQIPSVK